jgi:outer membrane protein assembly factor BamB
MKHLAPAAALVVIFALLTGCTPSAPTSAPSPQQVRAIWRTPANLVGQPQVVGDTIVSYLRVKQKLLVAAWDLGTGRLLWNTAAETTTEASGIKLSLNAITVENKDYVAYIAKKRNGTWREVVVAEARTGRRTSRNLVVWPSSPPRACSDGQAFCMQGYRPSAVNTQVNLRINPLAPALTTDRSDGLPTNSRLLGLDIFASEVRPPQGIETFGRMTDNKIIWQRPYAEVFGKTVSSDNGWAFHDNDKGIIAGIGYAERCEVTTKAGSEIKTCDETHNRMVGLNHDTGATVWSINGIDQCPNTAILEATSADRIIICRNKKGTSTYTEKGGWWDFTSKTGQYELLAVNHQTGEVLWHTDLGTQTTAAGESTFLSSDEQLILKPNGTTTVYDLATGVGAPASAASRLMCNRERLSLRLHRLGHDELTDYNIGKDVEPCDGNGKAIKEIPAEWVPAAGIDAGDGRWLLPTPGAMALVQLS